MRLHVRNLGALKEGSIWLSNLTLFCGANNTGKTWLAYLIGGMLGRTGWQSHLEWFLESRENRQYGFFDFHVDRLISEGHIEIDVQALALEKARAYFQNVANLSREWLPKWMGVNPRRVEDLEIEVDVSDEADRIDALSKIFNIEPRRTSVTDAGSTLTIVKDVNSPTLRAYTEQSEGALSTFPREIIERQLAASIFQIIHRSLHFETYVLPTERSAYLNLRLLREGSIPDAAKTDNDASMPRRRITPLSGVQGGFYDWLNSSKEEGSTAERIRDIDEYPAIARLHGLASLLERGILGGGILNRGTQENSSSLQFQVEENVSLGMGEVSSMVKELAAFVLYLRDFSRPDDFLVIDEPEMNLHPEAQARMAEFLAILSNSGLRILVTTHSPYLVSHLENLSSQELLANQDAAGGRLRLGNAMATIDPKNLSVQLFSAGTTRDIHSDDDGIEWETFSEVSDWVNSLRFEFD